MLRLDMSEYMERHTVSKLIGSPPGYVGYGEGGTLTEAIRKRPFTVVLLDEIEKAHPDIFNILLQLFEDGHLTDSQVILNPTEEICLPFLSVMFNVPVSFRNLQGRRVSFKNALIVMTSNIGSAAIAKGRQNFGFIINEEESSTYAGMKALLMEELKGYFRPELLNRIDEVVVFRPLEKPQVCVLAIRATFNEIILLVISRFLNIQPDRDIRIPGKPLNFYLFRCSKYWT